MLFISGVWLLAVLPSLLFIKSSSALIRMCAIAVINTPASKSLMTTFALLTYMMILTTALTKGKRHDEQGRKLIYISVFVGAKQGSKCAGTPMHLKDGIIVGLRAKRSALYYPRRSVAAPHIAKHHSSVLVRSHGESSAQGTIKVNLLNTG